MTRVLNIIAMDDTQQSSQKGLPGVLHAKTQALGDRLKRARKRRHLTLVGCADATGVSVIALRRIERGDPRVSFSDLLQLLYYFGLACDIDGLCRTHHDRLAPDLRPGAAIPLAFDIDN